MSFLQFVPIWAWLGGLISWIVSALASYIEHERRFVDRKSWLQGACDHDLSYADEIGDIDTAAALFVGGEPSLSNSFLHSHSQSLFVAVLTGAVTFFGSPSTLDRGWPLALWLFLLLASLFILLLSSPTLKKSPRVLVRWAVVAPVWLIVLLSFMLLASLVGPGSAPGCPPAQETSSETTQTVQLPAK